MSPSVIAGPPRASARLKADNSWPITVALSVAAPAETMPFLKKDRRLVPLSTLVTRFIALPRNEAAGVWRRPTVERLPDIVFVASVAARKEVVQDEVSDVATESVPSRQVVPEMDASENAALGGFIRSCRDAHERAFHTR